MIVTIQRSSNFGAKRGYTHAFSSVTRHSFKELPSDMIFTSSNSSFTLTKYILLFLTTDMISWLQLFFEHHFEQKGV